MSKIDKDILDAVTKSLNVTKIDLISPEEDVLQRALGLQSNQIQTLQESEIVGYIYVLAKYQTFLQVQSNVRNIRYLDAKRRFELRLAKEMSTVEGKTVKERTSTVLLNSLELQELEKEMRIKEADYIILEKIPDTVSEMTNALKKELATRNPNYYNKGRHGHEYDR